MMYFKNLVFGDALMLVAFAFWVSVNSSEAFGTFGLDIHHRYSDTVKDFWTSMGCWRRVPLTTTPPCSFLLAFFGSNQNFP